MDNGGSFLWPLLLQILLIGINAVFTSAEIALLSVNHAKLEKLSGQGNKKAKRLLSLTGEPAKFLATIQVGITLAGFLGSAFAADNFSGRLTAFLVSTGIKVPYATLSTCSVVAIILILSFFSLVLGELVPKRVAMKNADSLAFAYSGLIHVVAKIFAPVVFVLSKSTNGLLRLLGIDPRTDSGAVTEEEIRMMIELGSAGGTIKTSEKEFLNNVFEFDNKSAGEVMTHRRDTAFLSIDDDDREWARVITENRHNNFPVCGDGPDDIRGILNVRDYLILGEKSRGNVMKLLRPARFVPLSVRTDNLFRQMKKSRNHIAVVVDEHGSTMGIVTMNDLLEELVGDLEDDSSMPEEKPLIQSAGADSWYINGAASLDAVARELGIALPVDNYDTFAGFVFSVMGQIPEDGSRAELEIPESHVPEQTEFEQPVRQKLKISIIELREHRLEKALVRKIRG